MGGWQVKLCDPLAITGHNLSALAMGSSHNRALYKCPITLGDYPRNWTKYNTRNSWPYVFFIHRSLLYNVKSQSVTTSADVERPFLSRPL